jgi:hypothetical protein
MVVSLKHVGITDCLVRIQIGQIRFAMNDFNQIPSHPQRGRRDLAGVKNSRPFGMCFVSRLLFPDETLTRSKATTGTVYLT